MRPNVAVTSEVYTGHHVHRGPEHSEAVCSGISLGGYVLRQTLARKLKVLDRSLRIISTVLKFRNHTEFRGSILGIHRYVLDKLSSVLALTGAAPQRISTSSGKA